MQQSEGTVIVPPTLTETAASSPPAVQRGRLSRFWRVNSIRRQLLFAFLALVLLLSAAISLSSGIIGLRGGQRQVINQLDSVATVKEADIATWLDSLDTNLAIMLPQQEVGGLAETLLLSTADQPEYQASYDQLREHLEWMQSQSQLFAEVFLMDLNGRAVLSTNLVEEGKIHINQIYFREGLERSYFSTPFYSPSLAQLSVVAVRPVLNSEGRSIGVIAGRASMDKLSEIMLESAGLGDTGETYLVGPNHGLLTTAKERVVTQESAVYVRNEGVNRAISEEVKLSGLYEDFRGVPVVGVYYWYPDLQVTLVAEQDQAEAFSAIYTILGINFSVATIAVVVAIMVSLVVTRSIATPLTQLGQAAVAVEREEFDPDQLQLEEVMQRGDELGQLARVFQRMAREVYTRVQRLKQEVMQLQIVIDETKREKQVSELTETDFFRDLSSKAKDMRRNRKTRQEGGE
jgi:hypothetical protein